MFDIHITLFISTMQRGLKQKKHFIQMNIILSAKLSSHLHKWQSCGDSSRSKPRSCGIQKKALKGPKASSGESVSLGIQRHESFQADKEMESSSATLYLTLRAEPSLELLKINLSKQKSEELPSRTYVQPCTRIPQCGRQLFWPCLNYHSHYSFKVPSFPKNVMHVLLEHALHWGCLVFSCSAVQFLEQNQAWVENRL